MDSQQSHPVWDDDRVNEQSAFTSSPSSSTNSLSLSPVQVDRPPSSFESDRSASPPPRGLHVRLSKSRTNTPKAPAPTPNIRTVDNRRPYPLYSSSPVGSPKPTTPFIGAGYSLPTPASASYKSSIMAYFKRPAGIVAFGLILVLITACAFIGLSSQLVGLVQESHLSRLYKSQVECNPIVVVQTVAEDETKKTAISEPSPVPPPTIVTQYVTAPSVTPSGSCLIPSDSSLKQADGFWPRPLPNVVARDVPTPSEYAQSSASLVSLALAPRNQLDARYQATVDRLSGTDDFFHSHNNRPEDIAELQNPWPWARDNSQREDERRYIGEMWQHRLWQNGGGAPPKNSPVPLFPWDTRFSRFRGVTPKRTQLSDAGRAAGRLKIKGQHPVIENENETAHSLCNRLLSYNPILFHELPCPILWQDDNGRMRWNQAAERGFYNLLKEQQFPSQQLLAPEHTTTNGEIDCTRMKYIVLYGIGKGHGLFSRWKSYFRAWRNAMAFDPSRIIVWEHRRNTVAHSIEEDMLEEGILRYFAPHSICSNHPYVLDVIRDCGDNERVIDDPDRHMPKMKLIHTHEDMLKPEVQAVQFLRFGIDTWEDPAHAPQRMQLFHYKQTPYVEPYPIDGKPVTDQSPPSHTRTFSSWRERHVNLQTPTTFEHIYFAQEKTSRDSADNIRTRDLIYSEFAHRMLTAFAFNPSPDIHLMTKQLEHHWTSLMWDAEVEKVRNEIYEELTTTHPITKYDDTILPRLEAWRRVDRRLAEKIVRDSGSGWEESDEASMPKEIEDGMRDEVMATTIPKGSDYSQFQPRPSSCMAPIPPTSGAADTTNTTSTDSIEFERRVDATMNHLRTFGPSAFQVRPHSFGSLYPIAGLVIRRGDKAVEDSFYIEHGQFRPLSMFVWKLHEEESRRTHSRRRYERSKGMTAEVPRFRFPAIFVMTDDLGVYEEILNCANSYPAVRADNATHYKALYEAALEEEKKFTAASLAASFERMQAIRNDAAARVARGETVDPYILKVGVPWNPDGGIAHLLPGAQCRSATPPVCSPLSRFVLAGRTILHNVYSPPACFHPFKRVGFQQFLVTFQFFARNIQYWVGAMDSSMTQVLQILTESANQAHAHPQFGRITQGGTEKNPKWESWYPL